jgi:hypothetical protein
MSIVSGIMGAEATKSAGDRAASAQEQATASQQQMYGTNVGLQKPFYDVGTGAIPAYQQMLSGGYNMKQSPAAQYQLEQATKAMTRANAKMGISGGTAVNRLSELNRSVAAADWNNQYNRILDALKLGTGSSSTMGQYGTTLGNQQQAGANALGNIYQQQGMNQASLYTGISGNAMRGAGTGLEAYKYFNTPKASTASDTADIALIG